MSLFNWGNETPEQLAIRARMEQEFLYEQAARIARARNRAGNTPGVAGSGGKAQVNLDNTINNFVENDYVEDYFE
jgi:hypothetical protein